ncbi:DUF6705 family protein [Flavobacterium branchiicola]|uniref:DUF6705 family protein n=1 Tax=Flavobacterium branchiicola TaxID=1114875 RepID=A0ABV9PMU0_9FLAO|nr:DUF6705 family protein [Flavobacterium branchiicola]MBS7256494.1 hypothetical protein [Flavobacterium branchiicola]
MKKIIILGFIMLLTLSCKAQTIVPVEKMGDYLDAGDGIPDNTYMKDINNLLTKYVGTWKGSYKTKNYTFYITKYTSTLDKVTIDELRIRYLITSVFGTVLEDTRSVPETGPHIIKGSYFNKDLTSYASDFVGNNSMCGNKGTIFTRIKNNTNTQMFLSFEPDHIMISEGTCPGLKLAELTFPRDGFMLTKQ